MKTYEFKILTPAQNWEGIYECNGGEPNILMNATLECTEAQEKAFHRFLEAHKQLSKVCGGVPKLEIEEK